MRLEYRMIGPRPDAAPTIVMLHEGLGCVGLWGEFPEQLAAATGAGVFVYSRAGYGKSSPGQAAARDQLHGRGSARRAAARACGHRLSARHSVRPQRRRLDRGDLCRQHAGSSGARPGADGAAFLHRGRWGSPRSAAPATRSQPATLRDKLTRWHADVDGAFRSWNGPWLDPAFRKWDITEALGYIRVPILIVQGEDDQYGTLGQVEAVQEECYCPVETAVLPGARHSPHREAPEADARSDRRLHQSAAARPSRRAIGRPIPGLRPDAL